MHFFLKYTHWTKFLSKAVIALSIQQNVLFMRKHQHLCMQARNNYEFQR